MEWNRVPERTERLKRVAALLSRAYEVDAAPSVQQLCQGVTPNNPDEHIVVCPACGQMFDCRDRAQVAHHSTERHDPKLFL